MKKTAPDGLNWMIQAPCLLMRLRDYLKNKDKIRTKIRTKKTAPAGRTTRRMDFNPETLSSGCLLLALVVDGSLLIVLLAVVGFLMVVPI